MGRYFKFESGIHVIGSAALKPVLRMMKTTNKAYAERIAKEFDGILPYHEVFYIRSIWFAADRALRAFHRFSEGLQDDSESPHLVSSLQEAISHCAAISRFFWPSVSDTLAVTRGKTLCDAFQITEDNLLRSRAMRNHVEHFDERLDRFLSGDPMGQLCDFVVGSSDLVDQEATHVMLLVDPEAQVFVLFGEKYHFAGLVDCVHSVRAAASRMDSEGGRLKSKADRLPETKDPA